MWNIYYNFNSNWMPWYKFIFMIFRDWVISRDQEWSSSKITREILPDTPLFRTPENCFGAWFGLHSHSNPGTTCLSMGHFQRPSIHFSHRFTRFHSINKPKRITCYAHNIPQHPYHASWWSWWWSWWWEGGAGGIATDSIMWCSKSMQHYFIISVLNPWPSIISLNLLHWRLQDFRSRKDHHYISLHLVVQSITTYHYISSQIITYHKPSFPTWWCVLYMYIYIYLYMYVHIYIYIHMHV